MDANILFTYKKTNNSPSYEGGLLSVSTDKLKIHELILAEELLLFFNKRNSPALEADMGGYKNFFVEGRSYKANELLRLCGSDWGISYARSFALAIEHSGSQITHFNEESANIFLKENCFTGSFQIGNVFQEEDEENWGKRRFVCYKWQDGVLLSKEEEYV